ncbi:MAG: hypothetical protein QF888_00375 [Desulfobacterales bacterium]|nr:hypothetical protein [Desulfobacterales bacterium]
MTSLFADCEGRYRQHSFRCAMFLSAELIPGHSIIVHDQPAAGFGPEGYRICSCMDMENIHPIHNALIKGIGRERQFNFQSKLKHYLIDNYISQDSLEEYTLKCDNLDERAWRIKHVEIALGYLKQHDNLRIFLTNNE